MKRTLISISAIVILGISLYSNSLHGGFCSDDFMIIVENLAIRDIHNIPFLWQVFNTRFIAGLSFALNYQFGELNVVGYHVVNVLIHILDAMLVYWFIALTFCTPALAADPLRKHAGKIGLTASLIFLCHPIQVETVAFISQRMSSLAAFFYLSTMIFYIKGRLGGRLIYFLLAFASMSLGIFTKEFIVTLPILLTAYEFFFFGAPQGDTAKRLKSLLPFFLSIIVFLVVFAQNRTDSIWKLKGQFIQPFSWDYFFTEVNVLRTYLRLVFFPVNLQHDYDYPIAHGFFHFPTGFSAIVLIAVFVCAVGLFHKSRLMSFSICWFFTAILVEVIHPCFVKGGVIYEHWLYLAMVGFSIFLTVVLYRLLGSGIKFKAVVFAIVIILSLMTYERNKVWQSEFSLWSDNVKKTPKNPRAYLGLGVAYNHLGNRAREIINYEKAIALDPTYAKAHNNLAVAYLKLGRLDEAAQYARDAISLDSNYPEGYATLAAYELMTGEEDAARRNLNKAIELYQRWGDFQKAQVTQKILNRTASYAGTP